MNRQQRRKVIKVTAEEIKNIEKTTMENTVNAILKLTYEVMAEEFGFGEKRLDRLEKGILEKLEGM